MRRMLYAVAAVLVVADRDVAAQVRPVDPPRPCAGASAVLPAVDTTVDVGGGKPPTWLRQVASGGPRYPIEQRNARMQGDVRVSFVVDTTGKIIRGTAEVVAESHRAFSQSVCEFLRSARFAPVVLDGQPRIVRVTNQRFLFETR